MRTDIIEHLEDPKGLERLYRSNKTAFKKEFNILYPELQDNSLATYWNERLNYESPQIQWGSSKELTFVVLASLLAGFVAKLPAFFNLDEDFFYPRNTAFIVFPILVAYFAWKRGVSSRTITLASIAIAAAHLFINFLPLDSDSDTLVLACIHLPLFLWAVLGYTYVGHEFKNKERRLDFLRYNGDLVVMTTLILIAGMLLTGISIGLFSIIDIGIETFYFEYVVVFGLAASPIVGTYVTQANPELVSKVSPVIARIFSPLVLVTLVVYLVAILVSGRDPYTDRDFLITFNGLLIGVMAIILFSVAESSRGGGKSGSSNIILLLLAVVTVLVNCIALSAILFRITQWGITPNRLSVLGGNFLMLLNLAVITYRLYKSISHKEQLEKVEHCIATFLPLYSLWTVVVVFIFPFLFGFK